MPEFVYMLCAVTSGACALLLLRGFKASRSRLLLWSALCFFGLAVNNVLLFVDLVVVPSVDLRLLRSGSAIVAMIALLVGLIWETR